MAFIDVYTKVNNLLESWEEKGVNLAGETENAWVFKGHGRKNDDRTGACIIVDKKSEEMRLFNAGRPEDRDVIYNAKSINLDSYLK